jgi:hypothetical protein
MSRPKDAMPHTVVHGRLFTGEEAHQRLNRLVQGAISAAVHDHPDIALRFDQRASIAKRIVKGLTGNGYGLEIFLSIAKSRGGTNGGAETGTTCHDDDDCG